MLQIFNSGIGYILVVSKSQQEDVMNRLRGLGQDAWIIGEIRERRGNEEQVSIVNL